MPTEILPTAEGNLGRTPFAHLLVYAAEQQLTGALFLHEPSGAMHSVRLERGRAVKVQMGDGFARLGQMLVEAGVLDAPQESSKRTPGLIGETLISSGRVDRETLEKTVEHQFLARMTRLFGLSAETKYTYFADLHELVEDGAPLSNVHPLAVLWAGLREHGSSSAMMCSVLERVESAPLRLHRAAAVDRLSPTTEERAYLDLLKQNPQSLTQLVQTNPADELMLRRMTYALVIMRFIDFGTEALPLFPERVSMPPSGSTVTLARIRLQQNSPKRFMGAAPDDVGDGERIRPQPRTRKRSRTSGEAAAVRASEMPPPPSAIMATDPPPPAVRKLDAETASSEPGSDGDPPPAIPTAPEGQPDAVRPAHALYCLATKRLAEGDKQGALAACQLAREIDPQQPDFALLAIWIRAILGGSDLESCVDDLDKLLEERPDHVQALFYRGYLRRRIGDETGAANDLHRVLELDPGHEDATRELRRLRLRAPAKRPSGLYRT